MPISAVKRKSHKTKKKTRSTVTPPNNNKIVKFPKKGKNKPALSAKKKRKRW